MRRMKRRVTRAMQSFSVEPWEHIIRRQQWRYVIHAAFCRKTLWPCLLADWQPDGVDDVSSAFVAFRIVGRLKTRWDDKINEFCRSRFRMDSWTDLILLDPNNLYTYEDEYVSMCIG